MHHPLRSTAVPPMPLAKLPLEPWAIWARVSRAKKAPSYDAYPKDWAVRSTRHLVQIVIRNEPMRMNGQRAALSPMRCQGSRVLSDESNPTQYPSSAEYCIRGSRLPRNAQDPLQGPIDTIAITTQATLLHCMLARLSYNQSISIFISIHPLV